MSVQVEHRISHHRGLIVCVKCGGLQRVGEATSRLSWDLVESWAWRSSGEWRTPGLASLWRRCAARGWWWREVECDPGHPVPCPIPHGTVEGGPGRELGEGGGGRMGLSFRGGATLLLRAACWCLFRAPVLLCFCAYWALQTAWPVYVGPLYLSQKSQNFINFFFLQQYLYFLCMFRFSLLSSCSFL